MRITSTPFLLDVGATPANQRLYNDGPGTVYYKSDSSVSSSSNDGSVVSGASLAVTATQWIAAASGSPANVRLLDLSTGAVSRFAELTDVDAATGLVDGNDLYYDATAGLVKGHAPRVTSPTVVGNLGSATTLDLAGHVYSIFTSAADQATCTLTLQNAAAGTEWRVEITNSSGGSRAVTLSPGSVAVTVPASSTVTIVGSTPDGVLYQHRQVGAAAAAAAGTLVGYCSLTLTAAAAISAGGTNIPWDSELSDPQGMHSGSAATVTVPTAAGSAAIAIISAAVSIDITAGTRSMVIRKNTTQIRPTNNSFITDSAVSRATSSFQVPCAAGDTFDVRVAGSASNAQAGETLSVFTVAVFTSP